MAITAAVNNGGVMKTVHNEFDDGYLFTVLCDGDYVPVVFDYCDLFGEKHSATIAHDKLYHAKLMRKDGGVEEYDSATAPTFDWHELKRCHVGLSTAPNGDLVDIDGYKLNSERGVAVEGLYAVLRHKKRLDAEYWAVGNTLQSDGEKPLFGATQHSHHYCPGPKDCCNNVIMEDTHE